MPKVLEKYAGREDELLTRLHAQYKVPMLESAIKEKAAQIDNKTKLTMQYAEAAAAGASAKDPSSFLGPNVNHPAIQSLIEHFRREKQGYNIASVVAPLIEAVVKASPDAADKINGALSLYGVKKAGTTMTSASAAPASPTRSRSGSVVNGGPTAFTSSSSSFTAPAPVGGPGDGGGSGKSPSISAPSLFGGQTASTSINKPAGPHPYLVESNLGPKGPLHCSEAVAPRGAPQGEVVIPPQLAYLENRPSQAGLGLLTPPLEVPQALLPCPPRECRSVQAGESTSANQVLTLMRPAAPAAPAAAAAAAAAHSSTSRESPRPCRSRGEV